MNNRGFTLIEALFVLFLLSIVLMLGFNLLKVNNEYAFKGAKGFVNRAHYMDFLYTIFQEIQMAREVEISSGGKELRILLPGEDDFGVYTITDNHLTYEGENILSIKGDMSYFSKVYDDAGNELSSCVGINLNIERATKGRGVRDLTFKTVINVRNMIDVSEGS